LVEIEDQREAIQETIDGFANDAFRTLMFAYRDIGSIEEWEQLKEENNNFETE
jgi:magnesium-transporting ATPase (P-type)